MEVAILIPDKIDFKTKSIQNTKMVIIFRMMKGSIQEKGIILINTYALSTGAPKYIKQSLTDIKLETDNNAIIVGDFITPLILMYRSSRHKINKATVVLNNTTNQLDLIDTYRTFHPKTAEYTFFSSARGTLSSIDHMLGQKVSLNKFKKIEII